jgi:hypothetical protein
MKNSNLAQTAGRLWRILLIGAGAAAVLIALDVAEQVRTRAQLQEVADSAALVGVQALRDSVGQNDTQRRDTAIAATHAVTDEIGGANAIVTASVVPIYVSVKLSQTPGLLREITGSLDVVGNAGYLPPSVNDSEQQARLFNRLEWKVQTARAY